MALAGEQRPEEPGPADPPEPPVEGAKSSVTRPAAARRGPGLAGYRSAAGLRPVVSVRPAVLVVGGQGHPVEERPLVLGRTWDFTQNATANDSLLRGSTVRCVFHPAEKLEKRTCAFCPKGRDYSVLYFAPTKNIAAHENCLLYSSALVECEDNGSFNHDRNFDVESVKKEIQRGKKLKCTVCKERGATVGCDEKRCTKNYHFFCAQSDHAVPLSNHTEGTYKVFCKEHALKLPVITQSGPDQDIVQNVYL
ncbi:PHD finger protein 11 [Rhynchocyon petersi]